MSEVHRYPVPQSVADNALLSEAEYEALYRQSVENPEAFWAKQATRLDWIKAPRKIRNARFGPGVVQIRWFEDGTLNLAANCIDRHLAAHAEDVAIIWEGDDPEKDESYTFRELHAAVCRFANGLKSLGVGKGDRVVIYMPMIPQAAFAMLACARIGAVHSVVFGGFSPDALAGRIEDCGAKAVITADEGVRGGKASGLKANVDTALSREGTGCVEQVVVVRWTGAEVNWVEGRDVDYHALVADASEDCPPEEMNAEDPLFILYTSGSTGKPKGVLHTTGGYLVFASLTFEYVFDYHPGEVFWCTADVGWITGHTYLIYGPLACAATTVMFEGVPNYPGINRMSQVVDKHQVNILYTAPTLIRSLMREASKATEGTSRKSLRVLGTVGEPINPEAWRWYYQTIGDSRCPIVDTWWQTETGGMMITPLAGCTELKPGSATRPMFGIQPALVDGDGNILRGAEEGNLVILESWPGQSRSLWGDHERFVQTYFSTFPGRYFTGDGARRDDDGYWWITGRVDDVLNVSGHRMGTAEIESAMVAHDKVAEAAVVGFPHGIKGQGIYVYVTLKAGQEPSDALRSELRDWVRQEIGPIASPDFIQWAPGLPKTRSGKIMRRILRKIAGNDFDKLGDISTLAEPAVVQELIDNRMNR